MSKAFWQQHSIKPPLADLTKAKSPGLVRREQEMAAADSTVASIEAGLGDKIRNFDVAANYHGAGEAVENRSKARRALERQQRVKKP